MKKLSIQKISVLGVVLMAASAVTAAVLPSSKKGTAAFAANGSLTASDDNAGANLSCTATNGVFTQPCNNTVSRGSLAVSGSTANVASKSNQSTLNDAV